MSEAIGFLATDERLEQALEDVLGHVPATSRHRFVLERNSRRRRPHRELARLLFVSWAKDLSAPLRIQAENVSRRWDGHLVFVGQDTPAEALSTVTRLRVQDPSRLQFVTADDLDEARAHLRSFVQRFIHARSSEGILHAWWAGDSLEVLTTEFRRLTLPRSSIGALRAASAEACQELEVGYDGSHVAWPSLDLHIGIEQLQALVSPERALRRRQESEDFNRRYGAAIRTVRLARGLEQSSIPGLTARHLRRIERGESRATSKALKSLARAHGLSDAAYLAQVASALESMA